MRRTTRPATTRRRRTHTPAQPADREAYAEGYVDGLDYGLAKVRELREAIAAVASSTPEECEMWLRVYGTGDAS